MTKQNKAYKFRLYPTDEQAYLMRKPSVVYVSCITEC